MPRTKLTKRMIDKLEPGSKDAFYWDTDITGLALKVTPKGKKTFLIQYRLGGRGAPTRKVFIGPYGTVTLKKAQKEAVRLLGQVADGKDPALERRLARDRSTSDRFSDVADEFIDKHVSKHRTAKETERMIRRDVLPKWRAKSIHEHMKLAAADAIANLITPDQLSEEYIIPSIFDKRVVNAVAYAVAKAAAEVGVARRRPKDVTTAKELTTT